MQLSKNPSTLQKRFLVLKTIAVELVAEISLNYDKNTSDRPSTCEKKVVRFQIQLRAMIHLSICLILMESYHKIAAVQTSAVFWTP